MTCDVVIIGGGIIGCAIAWQLSERGAKVVLAEKDYFAQGASGSCDQGILLQSKAPGEHLRLGIYSMEMYNHLEEQLNRDLEFSQNGYLVLIENELELESMRGIIAQQNSCGLPVKLLSVQEAQELQPGLNPDAIVGAAYCPMDGEVNPYMTTLAFADRAAERGAKILHHTPVTGLLWDGSRVIGIRTPKEDIYADTVVNAAGAWAPQIGEMAGLHLPIKPRRGQIFISEAVPRFVHKGCINARYIVAKHHPELLKGDTSAKAALGVGLSFTQSKKGNVMFGATREFVGYDTTNTVEGLREVMKNAVHLIPDLKKLQIIRTMAGLRPWSPDSRPLIGYVKDVPGLFLAAGHEGDGISLAPATGKMAADLILDGKTRVPAAESFAPGRFEL